MQTSYYLILLFIIQFICSTGVTNNHFTSGKYRLLIEDNGGGPQISSSLSSGNLFGILCEKGRPLSTYLSLVTLNRTIL